MCVFKNSHAANVDSMLAHRLRRCPNVESELGQRRVLTGLIPLQMTIQVISASASD